MSENQTGFVLRGKKWLVISVIAWMVAAVVYLLARTPVFEAAVLLEHKAGDETALRTDAEKLRRLSVFTKILTAHDEAFPNAKTFRKSTAIRVLPRTSLIEIAVRHEDAEVATGLANALSNAATAPDLPEELKQQIANLEFHRRELLDRYKDAKHPVVAKTDAEIAQLRRQAPKSGLVVTDPVFVSGPVNFSPVLVIAAALLIGIAMGLCIACFYETTGSVRRTNPIDS